jgi:hypothetical protein
MSKSNSAASGGIGFTGLLAILFIGLKLLGKIDWSWTWVLSPIWIPIAIGLVFVAFALIMHLLTTKPVRR